MLKKIRSWIFLLCFTCSFFLTPLPLHAATYTYDELNRLTTITLDNGERILFTNDKAGNRTYVEKMDQFHLLNPNFERYSGSSGLADDWLKASSEGVNSQFEVVSNPIKSGTQAQKINVSGLTSGKSVALYQKIAIEPGISFVLSGSLRVDVLNQAIVIFYVDFYDETGKYITGKFIEQSTVTKGYLALQGQGTVPNNAKSAAVYVMIQGFGQGGAGTLYVDDLSFKTNTSMLEVVSSIPKNGEIEVDRHQPIKITFNKPIASGPEYSNITLRQFNKSIKTVMKLENNTIIINPVQLLPEKPCILTIPKNAVIDSAGNGVTNPILLTFTTKDETNLLKNAQFELYTGERGLADHWLFRESEGSNGLFEVNEHLGNKEQKISATGLDEGKSVALYQEVPLKINNYFELKGLLRVSELNQAKVIVYLDFYDETGEYISGKFIERSTVTGILYISLLSKGNVPQNAASAAVYVSIVGVNQGGAGTIYVDNLYFNSNAEPDDVGIEPEIPM